MKNGTKYGHQSISSENRAKVRNVLRQKPATPTGIAEQTGLSRATIGAVLHAIGTVSAEVSQERGSGRRRQVWVLRKDEGGAA